MQEQELHFSVPSSLPKCPYIGLDAFSEEDATFFFGREEDTETIVSNLQAWRLTLLYGESGVGKSSVLRAGVVAYLQKQAQQNLIERGSPKLAVVVYNRWREDSLLRRLLESINEAVKKAWGGQRDFPAFPFTGDLPELLQAWTERVEGELFIIFDQFEEYCLYNPISNDLASFEHQLAQAINTPYLRVNFLLSIRADALEKLDRFKTILPGLFDNYIRLNYLTRSAGALAIRQPLNEYNMYLPTTEISYSIEEQLIKAILDGVKTGKVAEANQSSGWAQTVAGQNTGIEAPYLQLVLTEIWQAEMQEASRILRLSTLLKLNGAESIVLNYLNSIMNSFSSDQRKIAVQIFRYFVTRSGTKHAQSLGSLNELTELPTKSLLPVLEKLEHSRILRSNRVSNSPNFSVESYEIFHDVLAPAILDWRQRYAAKMEAERQKDFLGPILRWLVPGIVLGIIGNFVYDVLKSSYLFLASLFVPTLLIMALISVSILCYQQLKLNKEIKELRTICERLQITNTQLIKKSDEIAQLDEITFIILPKNSNVEKHLRLLLDKITNLIPDTSSTTIFIPDKNNEYLQIWDSLSDLAPYLQNSLKERFYIGDDPNRKRGIAGKTFVEEKHFITEFTLENGRWFASDPDYLWINNNRKPPHGCESFISLPIFITTVEDNKRERKCKAVLCLDNKEIDTFRSEEVVNYLKLFTERLGLIINRYEQ